MRTSAESSRAPPQGSPLSFYHLMHFDETCSSLFSLDTSRSSMISSDGSSPHAHLRNSTPTVFSTQGIIACMVQVRNPSALLDHSIVPTQRNLMAYVWACITDWLTRSFGWLIIPAMLRWQAKNTWWNLNFEFIWSCLPQRSLLSWTWRKTCSTPQL